MLTLKTLGTRARAALFLTALATIATGPGQAAAASSGGWNNLGHGATATTPPIAGKVETFTNVGSKLYVGGDFQNAGGLAKADLIATWDGTKWGALGGGLGGNGRAVYAIAVDSVTGKVFAGGSFQDAGGDTSADAIAVFNGTSWSSLSNVGLNGPVFALAIVGRTLYIGGGFSKPAIGPPAANSIASYGIDSGTWGVLTDDVDDIGGTVCCLLPDGSGGLYVGGSFGDANNVTTADFIARWSAPFTWSALGSTAALNQRVRAIAVSGTDVYVGGDFTNADGNPAADKVAHWNGSVWSALGASSFFGDGGNSVYALTVDHGAVVAAGYFNNVGGLARADGIAAFVGGAWTNVGTSAGGTDGPVSLNTTMLALRVVGAKLYLGGMDSSIGDSTMNGFAAWYRIRQPDGQIKTTGSFAGNNIYNATGASQAKLLTVHRGNTGTFSLKIQNDGLAPEAIKVKGPGSGGGFTASYFVGATNVTAQVVLGTYSTGSLAPGASKTLTLKVKVGTGVAVGAMRSWLVVATSSAASTAKDSIKATVKAS